MFIIYLLSGAVIGVFTAIPAGPASVLAVYRTLNKSKMSGYFSGLGAATADCIFSAIAGFGISIIMNTVLENEILFKSIAVVILAFAGIRIIIMKPAKRKIKSKHKQSTSGYFGDYISTLGLTLSNPMGIFGFAAVFAGFNLIDWTSNLSVILIICGIACGAAFGWFLLISLIMMFKEKFKLEKLGIVNKIAGTIILGFAVFLIISII